MTDKRLTLAEMRSRLAVWDDWLDAPLTHVKSGGRYVVTGFSLRESDMQVLFSYEPIGSKVAFTRPVAEIRKFARTIDQGHADAKGGGTEYVHADIHAALAAENERLREALTPSAKTKYEYSGEFSVSLPMVDEDGDEFTHHLDVPWTTIKEIMKAIAARAALAAQED